MIETSFAWGLTISSSTKVKEDAWWQRLNIVQDMGAHSIKVITKSMMIINLKISFLFFFLETP